MGILWISGVLFGAWGIEGFFLVVILFVFVFDFFFFGPDNNQLSIGLPTHTCAQSYTLECEQGPYHWRKLTHPFPLAVSCLPPLSTLGYLLPRWHAGLLQAATTVRVHGWKDQVLSRRNCSTAALPVCPLPGYPLCLGEKVWHSSRMAKHSL